MSDSIEQDGTFIAGFRQCFIDFELSSLFRWALVFKTVRLDGPMANVILDGEGVLNLARLVPENPEKEASGKAMAQEATETAPPRLVLKHIQITEGEIDLYRSTAVCAGHDYRSSPQPRVT